MCNTRKYGPSIGSSGPCQLRPLRAVQRHVGLLNMVVVVVIGSQKKVLSNRNHRHLIVDASNDIGKKYDLRAVIVKRTF